MKIRRYSGVGFRVLLSLTALFLFQLPLPAYESDDADSLTNLLERAAAGDASAQNNLAVAYWYNLEAAKGRLLIPTLTTNIAVESRYKSTCLKCAFLANKATRSGVLPSIYLLGLLQFESGMTNRDEAHGRLFLLYAAIHDYKLAQQEYGKVLYHGLGGSSNWVEAAAFFRLAESSDVGLTFTNKVLFADIQSRLTKPEQLDVSRLVSNLRKVIGEQKMVNTPQYLTDDYIFTTAEEISVRLNGLETRTKP